MRNFNLRQLVSKCCLMAVFGLTTLNASVSFSQSILINPASEGGFELGSSFAANGWTVVNGTVANQWYVGTVPTGMTNNSAYISGDGGTTNAYSNSSSVVHFYRDITFPAGETSVLLNFNWLANGESGFYDALFVSLAPTSYTPTASSTSLGLSSLPAPAIEIGRFWAQTTTQSATLSIPTNVIGNCSSDITMRLIFTWKNDGSGGTAPSAAVDNIQLVSSSNSITSAGGTFTIDNTLPLSATNFPNFTTAITALNAASICGLVNPVIFNVSAGQTFNELPPVITANGTLSAPITFQKAGVGSNPVIVSVGTSSSNDGSLVIAGGDYFTFDGININNSASNTMEYGYLVRNSSATNGAKNIVIRNTNIQMSRAVTTSASSAILSTTTSTGGGLAATSAAGSNDNIQLMNITIDGAINGISMLGTSGFTGQNNVIGVTGANRNTITNIGPVGPTFVAARGVYLSNQTGSSILKTDISQVTSNQSSSHGIYVTGNIGNTLINGNSVYNISNQGSTSTSSVAYGIQAQNATTGTNTIRISNNMIGDIFTSFTGTATTTRYAIGIHVGAASATSAQSYDVFNNSVSIGSGLTPTYSNTCFEIQNVSAVYRVQNNIFANFTGAQGTTARHYTWVSTSATNFGAAGSISDNNDLYIDTDAGVSGFVARANTTNLTTVLNWTSAITALPGTDQNSFSSAPVFVNNNTDLHLNMGVSPTQIESSGNPSLGVVDDFDGQNRPGPTGSVNGGATAPDLGADEFDGVPLSPPVITLNSVIPGAIGACTASARLVSVDVVNTSGTLVSVELNYSVNGTIQTPIVMTNTSGTTWEGTIPLPTPLNANITWSVVAQNSFGSISSYIGTSYSDEPLTGVNTVVTATPSTICVGSTSNLEATLTRTGSVTIGTATTLTGATSQPTAFCNRWSSYRMQTVYTAAELTSAGLSAGPITSMAFNITTLGDGATNANFTVKVGTTALSAFTDFVSTTGYTTVYPSATYTHAVGVNVINFSTPFIWDGISNIVVEVSHNGANSTNNSQTYYTATPGNTVVWSTNGGGTGTTSTNRLNVVFTGNTSPAIQTISWSDGVSTVGTTPQLLVSPAVTTTYTATITASGCQVTPDASVTVTLIPLPSVPTATNSAQCGVQIPTAQVASTSGLPTPTFVWYDVATGGSALQSGTSATYTSPVSATTTFYVSELNTVTGCESVRVPVTVTVTIPDQVSLTSSTSSICIGESFTLTAVNLNGTPVQSYTYSTESLAVGSGAETPLTGATVSVTPTAAGSYTYSLLAVDGGCTATATTTVLVNSLPGLGSVTAQPAVVCSGEAIDLKAVPAGSGTFVVGAGSNTGTSDYYNPFYHLWGGVKAQFIIPASELIAAGLTAGDLKSVALDIGTVGTTYAGFTVHIGTTASANLSGGLIPTASLTEVYTTPSLALTANSLNTFTFSTPFAWDGTSNLIVQTSWSNNNTGGASSAVKYDVTSYISGAYFRADSNTPAAILAGTPANGTVTSRPKMTFYRDDSANYSWSWTPGSGLNTAVASTSITNISGSPINQPFTVTATDLVSGCSVTGTTSAVTINSSTLAPVANNSSQCGTMIPTASVTGSGTPGNTFSWYLTATGGTAILGETGSSLVAYSVSTTTTFYVSEISGTCSSDRTPVTVTVTVPPAITITGTSTICDGESTTLTVSSPNDPNYTYTWSGGLGTGAVVSASPSVNTTYTVVATDVSGGANDGCANTTSFVVTVNPSPTAVTASSSSSVICNGGSVDLTSSASANTFTNGTLTEGFETFPPSGWTMLNAGSGNDWSQSNSQANSGSSSMRYNYDTDFDANAWAISPQLNMLAGQTYTVSFWYKVQSSSFPEKLKVTVGNNPTVIAQSTTLWNNNGGTSLTNTNWAQGTITYTPTTSGNYYFGFNCYSDADNYDLFVDDISIQYSIPGAISTYEWTSSPVGFTSSDQNPANVSPTVNTTYTVTATNSFGCSNAASVSVVVNQPSSSSLSITSCDSYTWAQNGITYNTSGSYNDTIPNALGCDSVITLNLTINAPTTSDVFETACTSYTWAQNGVTYTTSGSYNDTIPNALGCDSIITLNLTINSATTSTFTVNTCEPTYTWAQNGTVYNATGLYNDTIPNALGCDSIITLNLTINSATTSTFTVTTCEPTYTWAQNGTVYNATGLYNDTVTNAMGCDSVITLDLTITPFVATATDNGDLTITATAGTTYQWIDCATNSPIAGATAQTFTATVNGSYAAIVSNGSCSDTSNCVTISNVGIKENAVATVEMFPNPTHNLVYITMSETKASVEVFDVQGKLLQTAIIKSGDAIDLSSYERGVYSIRVKTDLGTAVERVVKN